MVRDAAPPARFTCCLFHRRAGSGPGAAPARRSVPARSRLRLRRLPGRLPVSGDGLEAGRRAHGSGSGGCRGGARAPFGPGPGHDI